MTGAQAKLVAALAKELGIERSKVRAALRKVQAAHEKEHAARRDEFAQKLADKLGISVDKVKSALPAGGPGHGGPAGPAVTTAPVVPAGPRPAAPAAPASAGRPGGPPRASRSSDHTRWRLGRIPVGGPAGFRRPGPPRVRMSRCESS